MNKKVNVFNMSKTIILLVIAFINLKAFAFPEMIKHGYVNCTACHVSPSGGGLLNQYGRNLSAELISTWSQKNEEGILHGSVDTKKIDDWLAIGGDYRGVQVHTDTTDLSGTNTVSGRWINMQAGFEIGILQPNWALVAFIGEYNSVDRNHKNEILLNSPRYYALLKPTDEIAIKAGHFQPNFGLNLPDHFLSTRAALGLGYIINKDTFEISYLGENWNFIGSYYNIPGRYGNTYTNGGTLNVMYVFNDKYKTGYQILHEKGSSQKRTIVGLTGQLGWNEKLVTLIEADRVMNKPDSGAETTGFSFVHRTQYEVFKGFNVAVLNDYLQSNVDNGSTKDYKIGPGVIWYPRPHFDFQFFATREHSGQLSEPGVMAWAMTHYYF